MRVWAMDGWVIAMEGRLRGYRLRLEEEERKKGREEEERRRVGRRLREKRGWRLGIGEEGIEERIVTGQRSRRCGDTGKRAVHKTFLARYRRGISGIIFPTQTDRPPASPFREMSLNVKESPFSKLQKI